MYECTTEMEISRNIQILKREKTEAICQELEITTSNYWQIVHRSKLLFKKMSGIKMGLIKL
jgi:RNA polymerase sigma-70 factor (ECF subfamily)